MKIFHKYKLIINHQLFKINNIKNAKFMQFIYTYKNKILKILKI